MGRLGRAELEQADVQGLLRLKGPKGLLDHGLQGGCVEAGRIGALAGPPGLLHGRPLLGAKDAPVADRQPPDGGRRGYGLSPAMAVLEGGPGLAGLFANAVSHHFTQGAEPVFGLHHLAVLGIVNLAGEGFQRLGLGGEGGWVANSTAPPATIWASLARAQRPRGLARALSALGAMG